MTTRAFDDYLFACDQVDRHIETLEAELDRLAVDGPHREVIARLRCMRGIDTLTAIGLVAEAGDFTRFKTAEQFMSFVGLVPSERSCAQAWAHLCSPAKEATACPIYALPP